MLSMFQGKKGFSVLFTNRDSQLASPRPEASARGSRVGGTSPVSSRQSSHRCERCARLFRVDNTVSAADLMCPRCEFTTCPLCRDGRSSTTGSGADTVWQCCVCAMPRTLMRLLEQTRQGPTLVMHIMAFCDPRAERVLKSLFRTVASPLPSRVALLTGGHPSARALPASKRIAQQAREVRKSGTVDTDMEHAVHDDTTRMSTGSKGLRQRSKSGTNQQPLQRSKTTHRNTVHEDSEEAAIAEAENVITGSLERTMMDALTFASTSEASRTVTQPASSPSLVTFGKEVSVSAAALVSVSEESHSFSAGGPVVNPKSRSSAAFEREQPVTPRTHVSVETRMTRTDGAALSLSPLPKDTRARTPSSDSDESCRSASPAPRFPSYTEFLGDQEVARHMQGGRATGEMLTVSPDTDEDDGEDGQTSGVVELGLKRPSNTLNAASHQRLSGTLTAHTQSGTPPHNGRRTIQDSSAKRTATGIGRRRSSSSRLRRSTSGFTPRSVYKRQSSRRSTSRRTAHSAASSAAPSLPLYQSIASASASAVRASGSIGVEVGSPNLRTRKAAATQPAGRRQIDTRTATTAAASGPRRAPLATRTAGRVLGAGGKASGSSTPLNNSLHAAPAGTRTAGRFGRSNSSTTGTGFQRTASSTQGKLTRTASSSKHLSGTPSAALKRTNSSAKHISSPLPLARTQSRRASSPPTSGAAAESSPALGTRLVRTQSSTVGGFTRTKSGTKLTRTASSTAGAGAGTRLKRTATSTTAPLKRTKSTNGAVYARSATSAPGRARSGSQAQATPKRLVRVGSTNTPISRGGPAAAAGTNCRSSPKAGTTATPLRRTNTATPKSRSAAGGATPLTRTATGVGRFERKATKRRLGSTGEACDGSATPGGVVDDAPKLVHLTARRAGTAAGSSPSITATPNAKAHTTKTIKTSGAGGSPQTAQRFGRTPTRTKAVRHASEQSCTGSEPVGSQARSSGSQSGVVGRKTPTRRAAPTATAQHTEKVSRRGAVGTTAAATGTTPFRRQNSSRAAFGRQASRNAALHN